MERTKTLLAISGLLQVFFLVSGFLLLVFIMKLNGYPDEGFVRWRPLARGLREYGHFLMLAPVIWIIFTFIATQIERGMFTIDTAVCFGFLIALAILAAFLYASFNSYSRIPLTFMPTESEQGKTDNSPQMSEERTALPPSVDSRDNQNRKRP